MATPPRSTPWSCSTAGTPQAALERVAPAPEQVWKWVTWIWLHWYVALRAEAAVLAGSPDARDRLAEARAIVAGNPVAGAMVERAQALLDGDRERLLADGGRVRRRRLPLPVGADASCSPAASMPPAARPHWPNSASPRWPRRPRAPCDPGSTVEERVHVGRELGRVLEEEAVRGVRIQLDEGVG